MKKIIVSAIFILIIGITIYCLYSWGLRKAYPEKYSEYVDKYAKKYDIEREWIFAIIKSESNFEKDSVSNSGAKGLMQLMDETGLEMAKELRSK